MMQLIQLLILVLLLHNLRLTLSLNTFSLGLVYTNAALGAAAVNCLPVTTFFFAFLLGY